MNILLQVTFDEAICYFFVIVLEVKIESFYLVELLQHTLEYLINVHM